jgi:hypothetical protein
VRLEDVGRAEFHHGKRDCYRLFAHDGGFIAQADVEIWHRAIGLDGEALEAARQANAEHSAQVDADEWDERQRGERVLSLRPAATAT